ncbi:type VI secretion system tip protein VgrG [Cytophagaceae bacterium ABcell3]|nr:type VI secretion system tip protein VgrG [Cytophagaceae bacterium ABcell3]
MNNSGTGFVTYRILIDGNEVPGTIPVKSIMISKEVNRIPFAKLAIIDGDPASQDFEHSSGGLFVPGNKIEIKAGYHSDEETIFKGILVRHHVKIRSNNSYLLLEAKDEAVKMTLRRKSRFFYEMSDAEIMEELISAYDLDMSVEATEVNHLERVQYRVSDWDYLMLRAQANGFICLVDDGKITLSKPDFDEEPVETVSFGATMLEFDGEIDARNQVSNVVARSWSHVEQNLLEADVDTLAFETNGNLSSSELAAIFGDDSLEVAHGGAKGDAELQNWAEAKMAMHQMAKSRGRVRLQGIPSVKPGVQLLLEGVGDRFNGKAFISGVTHQIVEGNWTADAQFGLSPEWFAETNASSVNDLPASGLNTGVHGLQIGVVSQLEGDPDGEERVLVKLPIIDNQEQGIWCRQAMADAGNGRGLCFRPELEDEVVIGFINGDPDDAIILGMLHSNGRPSPIEASDENHLKGIVTREGLQFYLDDEKKCMVLKTPDGNKIEISDEEGAIFLEDSNGNKLVLDNAGISLESNGDINIKAGGDVNIEGMNVSAYANAKFVADGGGGAELTSSAIAVVKGSLVQIN